MVEPHPLHGVVPAGRARRLRRQQPLPGEDHRDPRSVGELLRGEDAGERRPRGQGLTGRGEGGLGRVCFHDKFLLLSLHRIV